MPCRRHRRLFPLQVFKCCQFSVHEPRTVKIVIVVAAFALTRETERPICAIVPRQNSIHMHDLES
jgi:hypothetical protein